MQSGSKLSHSQYAYLKQKSSGFVQELNKPVATSQCFIVVASADWMNKTEDQWPRMKFKKRHVKFLESRVIPTQSESERVM